MNILTLVPFDGFVPIMTGIVKGVYRDTGEKKICYISLNKPCKALIATLQGEGLDSTRFHIIDAVTKMAAGASLVQCYSGLVYRGPELICECVEAIRRRKEAPSGAASLTP